MMDAVFDVALRTLTLTGDQPSSGCDLSAKLRRYGQTIPLHGVSFGFSLTVDGSVTDERQWPPEGTHYVQTDQDTLATYRLAWEPEQTVTVDVWLVDALGQQHTDSVTFTAPLPPEPVPPPDPDPLPDPGGNESIPSNVSL
jgi:hypothetical protein